jgi:hypothetical protein
MIYFHLQISVLCCSDRFPASLPQDQCRRGGLRAPPGRCNCPAGTLLRAGPVCSASHHAAACVCCSEGHVVCCPPCVAQAWPRQAPTMLGTRAAMLPGSGREPVPAASMATSRMQNVVASQQTINPTTLRPTAPLHLHLLYAPGTHAARGRSLMLHACAANLRYNARRRAF